MRRKRRASEVRRPEDEEEISEDEAQPWLVLFLRRIEEAESWEELEKVMSEVDPDSLSYGEFILIQDKYAEKAHELMIEDAVEEDSRVIEEVLEKQRLARRAD